MDIFAVSSRIVRGYFPPPNPKQRMEKPWEGMRCAIPKSTDRDLPSRNEIPS